MMYYLMSDGYLLLLDCGHYGRSRILEWMIEQVFKQYGKEDTISILN